MAKAHSLDGLRRGIWRNSERITPALLEKLLEAQREVEAAFKG